MSESCVFCQIINGLSPARIYYTDEQVTAFQTTHPIAPVHILIVPNRHISMVNDIEPGDEEILGHMLVVAKMLAAEHHVNHSGYRLVINNGHDAGQSVYHLHLHLIGGKHLPFRFE